MIYIHIYMHILIYISSHLHTCARMHVVCMARLIRRGCYASKRCTCVSSVVRLSLRSQPFM